MYLRMGNSESSGDTSPKSDLKGAPNRRSAVGELSSEISHLTCSEMSSRFKSRGRPVSQRMLQDPGRIQPVGVVDEQCSCLPVRPCFGAGAEAVRTGSSRDCPGPECPSLSLLSIAILCLSPSPYSKP